MDLAGHAVDDNKAMVVGFADRVAVSHLSVSYIRDEVRRPRLMRSVTEIQPVVHVGAVAVRSGPFMTLKPVTARPDHMDAAGGRRAVEVGEVPRTDAVVGIGEISRLQAVTE